MSQQEKSRLYQALKNAGVEFSKHYRQYSVAELQAAYDKFVEAVETIEPPEPLELSDMFEDEGPPKVGAEPSPDEVQAAADAFAAAFGGAVPPAPVPQEIPVPAEPVGATPTPAPLPPAVPTRGPDPDEMAGARLNDANDQPLRQDEYGRFWFQEEVRKPAYPKSRGRRVLRTQEPAAERKTVQDGKYTETFEVAGTGPLQATEIKVTLPSYQVGFYRRKGLPFGVHTYNGNEGFDREEIDAYYGGRELVPAGVKRKYVENVLCYDIPSVVRAITAEHRHMQLTGQIKD